MLAACVLPVLLSACAAAPVAPPPATSAVPNATHSVHVVNHGWHAGLVLRAGDMPAGAWPAKADFRDAVYFEVGWATAPTTWRPNPARGWG